MAPEASWHVRIQGREGSLIAGAGVLIDSRRVLTCAHVITKALSLGAVNEAPANAVRIDFPQCEGQDSRTARVIPGGWFPEHGSADIAVLEVEGDEAVRAVAAPLRPSSEPELQMIYAYGHPAGHDGGVWALARLVAAGGARPEWVQMEALRDIGKRIQRGYSGAGVWDEEKKAVIGCVIAADRAESDRVAWMIPVQVIARYWRELQSMLQQEAGRRQRDGRVKQPQGQRGPAVMPSGDQQWIISVAEQLTIKLRALSVARDTTSRALLVQAVEAQFAGRLQVSHRYGDYHIRDLIDACLAHPGALHELVRLLGRHANESEQHEVEEIKNFVEETIDPDPLLLVSERNDLYALLDVLSEDITVDMVLRCNRETAAWSNSADVDPRDIYAVIRSLESATWVPDELPPLVHFLELLSLLLPSSPTITDLRSWVDAFSNRQGVPRHLISRLRVSPPPSPLQRTTGYLMTELSRFGADESHYLTRITLRAYGTDDQVLRERELHYDDTPLTIAEIPHLFDSVLSDVWDATTAGMEEIVIEFVLPLELLGNDVDQWVINDVVSHPVCSEHHVQVRSTDRKILWQSHKHWRKKTMQLHSGHVTPRWIYPSDEYDFAQLFQELIDEDTPCLVLARTPSTTRSLGNDPVSVGIRTGVPVIIWCRDEANLGAFTARLRAYLAHNNNNAVGLRGFVRQLRTDNVRFGDPTGAHITLIWDPADGPASTTIRHQAPTA